MDIVIAPGPGEINEARKYNVKLCLHNNQPTNFFQLAKLLIGAKYIISENSWAEAGTLAPPQPPI